MLRRKFLKQLAAAGAASHSRWTHASPRRLKRVGVVGAGIVGASVAYHLTRAGAQVTLFDKALPASGATQNSFAWLNAFVPEPDYRALRLQSLMAYHDLDRQLRLGIVWGGYTNWARTLSEVKSLEETAGQMDGTPYGVRRVDGSELVAMTPSLVPGTVAQAFFSRIDGHLDPVKVTRRFVEAAGHQGSIVKLQCEVQELDITRGVLRGVKTAKEWLPFDHLVVAAGVDTPRALAQAGFSLKLRHSPGILAHSAPTPIVTAMVFDAPEHLSFKQMADGSIVGTDSPEPPDIPAHREIREHATGFPDEALRAMHGNRILGRIGEVLPPARGVPLERLTLGFRPMPLDELPVVGAVPGLTNLYVVVTHSGVTLAPILGRYVTQEIMSGSRIEALAPFRPDRFS